MTEDCPARIDIFTAAEPTVTRIIPELAAEIGLNESIMLLQIAFWIKHAQNCIEGKWWTYQSVRDMQEKAFCYMGLATINRTIKNLEDRKLITTGNHNKRKGDKTRWFTLNPEGLAKLKSIKVVSIDNSGAVSEWNTPFQNGTPLFQDDTPAFQSGTPSDQNGTTLPETPTKNTPKTTQKKSANAPARKTDVAYPVYEALVKALEYQTKDINRTLKGQLFKVAHQLIGAENPVKPEEIASLIAFVQRGEKPEKFSIWFIVPKVAEWRKWQRGQQTPPGSAQPPNGATKSAFQLEQEANMKRWAEKDKRDGKARPA